ncbi:hypothetical protein [Metabacillus idriensis]|uniref:hypothetical protein n=1 Tax=Metabacillus idriensis TaxID=324768 RepID=UPI00174E0372|nr:hypothetical protein [Metabacillus idriensis]
MLKKCSLIISSLAVIFLAGCDKEPLKFRNMIEADKYYHSNIENMEWDIFKKSLSSNSDVDKEDFRSFQELINEEIKSFHVVVDEEMYRFTPDNELLYQTIWKKEDGTLKLQDIYILDDHQ